MSEAIYEKLFPNNLSEIKLLKDNSFELVHYTSAESLVSILRNKSFWLRPTYNMNDYSEGLHGLDYLNRSYIDESFGFKKAVEKIFPGKMDALHSYLDRNINDNKYDIFIGCFSQHKKEEDLLGRLSMWRAYGRGSGVAMVLNKDFFQLDSEETLLFSKVSYDDELKFKEEFRQLVLNIQEYKNDIMKLGFQRFSELVLVYFLIKLSSQKHPGFKEELEWRLIHMPKLFPIDHVKERVHVVNGLPQRIYEIFFYESTEPIDFDSLVKKIIIGPCKNGLAVFDSLMIEMKKAGIKNPHEKIVRSDIPLRLD